MLNQAISHPLLTVASAASMGVLFVSNYGAILADTVIPPSVDWISAAERLGVLATVVMFSVFTAAGILKWLLNRQAKREDQTSKAGDDREVKLFERVTSLETKVVSLAESNGAIAQRSVDALERVSDSVEASVAIGQAMQKGLEEFLDVRRRSACYAFNPDIMRMALQIQQAERVSAEKKQLTNGAA